MGKEMATSCSSSVHVQRVAIILPPTTSFTANFLCHGIDLSLATMYCFSPPLGRAVVHPTRISASQVKPFRPTIFSLWNSEPGGGGSFFRWPGMFGVNRAKVGIGVRVGVRVFPAVWA